MHLVSDERACPGEQAPGDKQDGCQNESDADQQSVKSLALHVVSTFSCVTPVVATW